MAITRQQKEDILAELVKKFSEAKSVAFGQYAGMSVSDMQTMRRSMREAGVEFKVAKKTLLKLAAKEAGVELPSEIIEGTVGAAFSFEDAVSGPKVLKETSKKVEVVKLLGGVMDGKVVTISQMKELADLPSREALIAKFAGMMRAPLQSFHGMASGPLGSLARALEEYSKQMPAEEAAAAPAEETPKEEAPAAEAAPEAPAEEAATEEAPAETPEAEAPAEEAAPEAAAAEEAAPAEESTEESAE